MTAAATWRQKLEMIRPRKRFFVIGSSRIIIMTMGVIPWMAYAILAVAVKVDV
jgi:hypothetical protein